MTPDRLAAVPNQPKTPMHSFRVNHDLWLAAKAKAAERDEKGGLNGVLVRYLERYVKR